MKLSILFTLLIFTFSTYSQNISKTFGGSQDDKGEVIIECSNNDLIIGGITNSFGAGGKDIILTRISTSGGLIWSKTYGLSDDEDGLSISLYEANNNDILLAFRSYSINNSRSGVVMRLNSNGGIIWQKKIGIQGTLEGTRGIIEHANGDIYIGIGLNSSTYGSSDGLVVKLDATGNTIWSFLFGVNNNDHVWSLLPLPNGEVLINANSVDEGPGNRDAVFIKLDSNGNIQDQIAFGGTSDDIMNDMVYVPEFGYIVSGRTNSYGQGGTDAFIAKFDFNFNLDWFKTYGYSGTDNAPTVEMIDNNHFSLYMNTTSSMRVVGVDSSGNTLYVKKIGNSINSSLNEYSSQGLIYSQNQNKTFLTNSFSNSQVTSNILFMALMGTPSNICSDTIINESFHTPTITTTNFNHSNSSNSTNTNITSSTINNLTETNICLCPFNLPTINDSTICPGEEIQFNLDPSYTYNWQPASNFSCTTCPDPIFTGMSTVQAQLAISNGNCTDTLNFTINASDTIPPTGTAPANLSVQCLDDVPASDINAITDEADNCTVNPIVTFVSDYSDTSSCPTIIYRTYNIADTVGNNINVTQTITVNDTTNPTGTAPADAAYQCVSDIPAADITAITDEADNCTDTPIVTHVSDVSDGNTCPEVITRTYNIADECGNNIDVVQTFTINDDTNPTGTAPADVSVQCIGDVPAVDIAAITDEADNCSTPVVSHVSDVSNGNSCPEIITRTYNIADDCGNNIDVVQTITIIDDTNPTGTAPADVTVQCIGDVPAVDVAAITDEADNCTVSPTVTHVSDVSDGNTCPETITRTYNIEDDCGNNIDLVQTITINDDTNPTGTAPADTTVQCIGDVPLHDISLITDEADNCTVTPTVTFVSDVSDGNTCPETITRTYNIADDCGNSTDLVQTITINDEINPTGTAPADLTVQCIGDVPAADMTLITDEADNCTPTPIVTHVSDVSDGNTCPEVITRTYNIADDCGNNIDLVQTITIKDDVLPTASNPPNLTVECLSDVPAVDVNIVTDEADNCTANPTVAFVSESTDGNTCNGEIITRVYSVTDDCGNSINVSHTILVDSYTPTFTVSGQGTNSCDGTDGEITLSGLTPNTDYKMSYDGGNTNTITTDANGDYVITGLPAGSYTNYTVTDADCPSCTTTENTSININDPTAAVVGAGPDAQYCEGTSITLNAYNPENALVYWDNGVTDGAAFVPPVGVNYYTVTSERVNCFAFDQVKITVSPAITDITCPGNLTASCDISEQAPYANFDEFIAAGGSATIPQGGVIDSTSFNLLSEVSDGVTCPETITRTYEIADTCGVTVTCTQDIVINEHILPVGTAPADVTVQCISDVPVPNINEVTSVSDNCTSNPIVTFISDVSDGNTCPETITRSYEISDICGNRDTVRQTITVNDDILPTASNPDTITVDCLANVPAVDVLVVTDEADNCTANPTVTFVSESSDGNTCDGEEITRIYNIEDDCGNNIDVTQIIVVDVYDPTFTLSSSDPTTCDGSEGTITISGLLPSSDYELTYNGGAPTLVTTDVNGDYVITGLVEGTYTGFTLTEAKCMACTTSDNSSITLTDPLPPVVSAGNDTTVCETETVILTAFNPDNATITWDNNVTDGVGFIPPVGTTTYTVTAEKFNCFSTDEMDILVNPLPNVDAGVDQQVCDGEQVTLTATGAVTYAWDNGITNSVTFTPTLGTTTYTVTGTSALGCEATDQVDVEVMVIPEVSFIADQTIGCAPEEINLLSTTPGNVAECIFSINGVQQSPSCDIDYTFMEAGCYDISLEVELTNGCVDNLMENNYICIDDYPVAKFTADPEEITNIYNEVDFTNESTGATNYEWNFGDGNHSNFINPTHEYQVDEIVKDHTFDVELIAYSQLGCTDTFNLPLPFYEELIYFVPNTFTPDGSNTNDVFKPVFTSGFDPQQYRLLIFNRWGEVIFESNDASVGWDGTYGVSSTKVVPNGTYVWKIFYTKYRGDEEAEEVGHVNLLR